MRTVLRSDIIAAARGWIGTPYQHQASLKHVGADCLGLVRGVWREVLGAEPEGVPAYSAGWTESGAGEKLADGCRRHAMECAGLKFAGGDLLLVRWRPHLPAKHAAIAVSCTRMVHAQDGAAVAEVAINAWWRRHLAHDFQFPGVSD